MKIDRSNYEIWLIDWLDGNLSDRQVEQLKVFLTENPELKEEIHELKMLSLKPAGKTFPHKDHLKKSTADLSRSHFEFLCVAYLEKDLSADQETELMESIDQDPGKRWNFELIQRLRLIPAPVSYKLKNQLIKRTPFQRVIQLSAIGLTTAATIALLIMTWFLIPRNLPEKINNTTQYVKPDISLTEPSVDIVSDRIKTDKKPLPTKQKSDNQIEILFRKPDNPETPPEIISFYPEIDLKREVVSNKLVPADTTFNLPLYEDERSNLSRLIAKAFREKILKETTSKDSPLRAYEIAEAGITGLNILLGWEMALDKNMDENGELKSVYFRSKLLKFNAPVKKPEPLL